MVFFSNLVKVHLINTQHSQDYGIKTFRLWKNCCWTCKHLTLLYVPVNLLGIMLADLFSGICWKVRLLLPSFKRHILCFYCAWMPVFQSFALFIRILCKLDINQPVIFKIRSVFCGMRYWDKMLWIRTHKKKLPPFGTTKSR